MRANEKEQKKLAKTKYFQKRRQTEKLIVMYYLRGELMKRSKIKNHVEDAFQKTTTDGLTAYFLL